MFKKIIYLPILFITFTVFASPNKEDYPHWNFENKSAYNKLEKIDKFIKDNKDKGEIAVFDWDGTLYNEEIPLKENKDTKMCGQAGFLIWSAVNKASFNFPVFPSYETKVGKLDDNVKSMVNYLEHQTNAPSDNPAHTFLYATFFNGMTVDEISKLTDKYLSSYPVDKNMFYPVFDVLQKMLDSGFNVWIVTGSNEYLVANMLNNISGKIQYTSTKKYSFPETLASKNYNKETGHIAGNSPELNKDNKFSNVDDYKLTKNSKKDLYVIDGEGKEFVLQNLEKKYNKKTLFVAGNSGGDFYNTKYAIGKNKGIAIAINPRGSLTKLVKQYPNELLSFSYSDNIIK